MDLKEQYDRIYRYCYFKVHHRQIAEDLTQEAFLRFFDRHTAGVRELPYLYTIARNLCIEEYRRESRETSCVQDERSVYDPSGDWTDSIALKTAISKLPREDQEILLLRYANELPVAAISRITGLSRFAVYRRTSKALQTLKSELEEGGLPVGRQTKNRDCQSI